MAFGKEKGELLVTENAAMKVEIRMLREQLTEKKDDLIELRDTLRRCQDALIAKESPEAYRDQVHAEYAAKDEEMTDEQKLALERRQQEAALNSHLLQETESDLFKDAEDMISMLGRTQGAPTMESLHGDGES